VCILTKEREHPPDVLLAHLTDEFGKDGWIRESVDLSRFTLLPVNLDFLARTDGSDPPPSA
jgi:hypothetical protein